MRILKSDLDQAVRVLNNTTGLRHVLERGPGGYQLYRLDEAGYMSVQVTRRRLPIRDVERWISAYAEGIEEGRRLAGEEVA